MKIKIWNTHINTDVYTYTLSALLVKTVEIVLVKTVEIACRVK